MASIAIGLAVGLAAGYLARSRWAMLLAALGLVVAYELVRLPTEGPTVDGLRLTTDAVMALVMGRWCEPTRQASPARAPPG